MRQPRATPITKGTEKIVTRIDNETVRSPSSVRYRSVVSGLIVLVVLSLVGCWSATAFYGVDKLISSNVFVTISTTSIVIFLLLPWFNLKGQENLDHGQRMERMAVSWLVVLGVAHLTWELPWVLFHSYLMGVIAAVLAYLHKKAGRFTDSHLVAVIALMACEFYVTVIYILSEVYEGMPHVNGAANLVVKFIYGNILWLVVPWIVFLWARRVLLSRVAGPH